jgi:predicted dehydrogenase
MIDEGASDQRVRAAEPDVEAPGVDAPGTGRPLRLGLVAAARITGPAIVDPVLGTGLDEGHAVAGVELVAVAARDAQRARIAADEWGVPEVYATYEDLIDRAEVDAVYVATPAALHRAPTLRALAAGRHVLCEKPLAANAEEARVMVEAAAAADRLLMEAFHWRYHPLVDQLAAILASGRLGTIERIDAAFDLPEGAIPRTDIRWDLPLGGGALMDLGCYPAQWARFVAGAEPTVVSATADCPVPGIDARLSAELSWPSGATGSIHCSMMEPGDRRDIRLEVHGSAGHLLVVNPLAPQHGARLVLDDGSGSEEIAVERTTTYGHQLRAFVEAVRTGTPPPTSGEDSIATMTLIDACYRAAGLDPRPTLA